MATLSISLPASVTKAPPKYRMYIRTLDNKYKFGAPFAPKNIEYGGFGKTWAQIPRDGRSPLLVPQDNKLPTLSFTLVVARPDPDYNATSGLDVLKNIANSSSHVSITYGGVFDSGRVWRMTGLTFRSVQRHPVTSHITHAEVDLEFTAANNVLLSTGPLKGGKKPAAPKPPAPKKPVAKKPTTTTKKAKTYTIKTGDTLISIAGKVYGDTSKWRDLAIKNDIKNPRKLPIGKVLKL